ncbi:MAG: S41 family peptidase [Bacteroidales bacterium]
MKLSHLLISMVFVLAFHALNAQEAENLHFVTNPTLSPDGKNIVFTYENDLWSAKVATGKAHRLTGMEGIESHPRFSPDGEWIAFSSTRNGNADVFVMPVNGGKIRQLTWHDAPDYPESWSWDGKSVYFTSERYNQFTTFKISAEGGTPERMFPDFFNTPHHLVEHPENNELFFTESWESYRFPQRKRYKGDHNPEIKSWNPETKNYKEYTDYEGKDFWPTIDRHGKLYFVSDEWNDEYNLYTFENGEKKRLTSFDHSIERPQVSANGEKVVFCKDYQPHIYNVEEGTSKPLNISLYPFDMFETEKEFNVKGKITDFDVSPDNKKIAFVSRGRLFVSDADGKFIKEMPTDKQERVAEVKWDKTSKKLIYTRTDKGWTNIFTLSAEGNSDEKQLTSENQEHRALQPDSERSRLVYIRGGKELVLMDLNDYSTKTLVDDEFWFRGSTPRFSPDDNFIAYTAYRKFEQDVFIYDIQEEKKYNITQSGVTERQPFWSPDGKYIYLASDRFQPSFPRGTDNSSIYRIPLYKFKNDFKSDKYKELYEEETKKDTLIPEIKFDFDRLKERWDELSVRKGQQFNPHVYKKDEKTIVYYSSDHDGSYSLWKMELDPYGDKENTKISDNSFDKLLKVKKNYYTLENGNIYKFKEGKEKQEKIELEYSFSKVLQDEFTQMFYENWSILKQYFYDENFHGIDWDKMKEKYEEYLPHVQTRDNLRTLFNDMLGELNSSHLGFSSTGEEEKTFYNQKTAETGIVFDSEDPYTVDRIVSKSPMDITENEVEKGDKLVAVNDKKVDESKNRQSYFSFADMPEELKLTFQRGNETYETKVHPITGNRFKSLLYDEWIHEKQEIVDEKTGKKAAYVYMKDMSTSSLEDFLIDMTTESAYRDGLILDLRYNRGGNVHDDVLRFLSQRPYLQWKARGGSMSLQPNFAPSGKPIILLVNEHSLSDAEMTAAGFNELGLGTIVGTETYRWIIFTSGKRLVDGSYTRLPTWGCYTLDGEDLEMTGVKPDIYINNSFQDRLEGEDPQLEKAINLMMEKLGNN